MTNQRQTSAPIVLILSTYSRSDEQATDQKHCASDRTALHTTYFLVSHLICQGWCSLVRKLTWIWTCPWRHVNKKNVAMFADTHAASAYCCFGTWTTMWPPHPHSINHCNLWVGCEDSWTRYHSAPRGTKLQNTLKYLESVGIASLMKESSEYHGHIVCKYKSGT